MGPFDLEIFLAKPRRINPDSPQSIFYDGIFFFGFLNSIMILFLIFKSYRVPSALKVTTNVDRLLSLPLYF